MTDLITVLFMLAVVAVITWTMLSIAVMPDNFLRVWRWAKKACGSALQRIVRSFGLKEGRW